MADKTDKVDERIYIIPLKREVLKVPRIKRANRAVKTIQSFLQRHMKSDNVKISQRVNEVVWIRGIHHPPSKIKLKARREGEIVYALLPDEKFEIKKKEKKTEAAEGAPKSALQQKAAELSEKLKREKGSVQPEETKKEEPKKAEKKKTKKK